MARLTAALLALGASSCAGLVTPTAALSAGATDAAASATAGSAAIARSRRSGSSRRELLVGAVGSLAAAALPTAPAHASYALYQSSYDSFQERKATNYVPVATSDRDTLDDIQAAIRRKRPQNPNKPQKAPQYCAGQTASVTPMLENVCANIGVSKADQSNTMTDAYGNANIGAYTSARGADRAAADARMARVSQAAEAARLRQQAARGRQ